MNALAIMKMNAESTSYMMLFYPNGICCQMDVLMTNRTKYFLTITKHP